MKLSDKVWLEHQGQAHADYLCCLLCGLLFMVTFDIFLHGSTFWLSEVSGTTWDKHLQVTLFDANSSSQTQASDWIIHNPKTPTATLSPLKPSSTASKDNSWLQQSPFVRDFAAEFELSAKSGRVIRLMSFNLRNAVLDEFPEERQWATRRPLAMELWGLVQADIVGTQEGVLSQLESLSDELAMSWERTGDGRRPSHWFDSNSDRMNEFCALFHRRKLFTLLDEGTFWLSETPSSMGSMYLEMTLPRIASWILVALRTDDNSANDSVFLFVNTHLDHLYNWARGKEIDIIEKFVVEMQRDFESRDQSLFAFVTGDFNEAEDSPLEKGVNSTVLVDCLQNFTLNVPMTYHAFEGLNHLDNDANGAPIDWILCSPNVVSELTLLRAFVVDWNSTVLQPNEARDPISYPSDHFPIVLDFQIPPN